MRKQESSSKDDENVSHMQSKTAIHQHTNSTIIPPTSLAFMSTSYAVQTGIESETAAYPSHELKPHLTELRPIADSTLGNIQSIFIPSSQQNGYEIISNSSFLTPSPQPNPIFNIGISQNTSPKMNESESEDTVVNIKTETPPNTPATESTHMSFSSKLGSATISTIRTNLIGTSDCKRLIIIDEAKVLDALKANNIEQLLTV